MARSGGFAMAASSTNGGASSPSDARIEETAGSSLSSTAAASASKSPASSSYTRLPFGRRTCEPPKRWTEADMSVGVPAVDLEAEHRLPSPEHVFVREKPGRLEVIGLVLPRAAASHLHPVVARARPHRPGLNVDVVGPAGRPVVAGALAVVILPRRAETLGEIAGAEQIARDDRGVGLEDVAHLQLERFGFDAGIDVVISFGGRELALHFLPGRAHHIREGVGPLQRAGHEVGDGAVVARSADDDDKRVHLVVETDFHQPPEAELLQLGILIGADDEVVRLVQLDAFEDVLPDVAEVELEAGKAVRDRRGWQRARRV